VLAAGSQVGVGGADGIHIPPGGGGT
jgi:hypothetical protein